MHANAAALITMAMLIGGCAGAIGEAGGGDETAHPGAAPGPTSGPQGGGSIPPPDCQKVDCEGPPYPRTAAWAWGGMSPDWAARFDLVIMWPDAAAAMAIKEISPQTLVLPTHDWNAGGPLRTNLPTEWAVHQADGSLQECYCHDCGEYLADFTDCLGRPDCGLHDGQHFTEALVEALAATDLDLYDGLSTDGFWNHAGPYGPLLGIDLDRNGQDDNEEHGSAWVDEAWTAGTASFIERLRERIGGDVPLVVNSGYFHEWWWPEHNGPLLEGGWALYGWWGFKDTYAKWMGQARKPHLLVVDGRPDWDAANVPADRDTGFRLMRFLLGTTLLGDGYFEFSDTPNGAHDWLKYYDEFDLELGYPTKDAREVADGVFVRFFSGGALILNANPAAVTVSDAELQVLEGYQGPYFRFRGGQDPAHNDGTELGTVTLAGSPGKSHSDVPVTVGDAIIVMRAPVDVVADIVVDDREAGTTPGSAAASLSGLWQPLSKVWGNENRAWHPGPPWDASNALWAPAGAGQTQVEYRPTIGLAGYYEVSFFHGALESAGPPATDMPCRLVHADGEEDVSVDVGVGMAQWTTLGVHRFSQGDSGHVVCSDQADGAVIADAMRFAYQGQ